MNMGSEEKLTISVVTPKFNNVKVLEDNCKEDEKLKFKLRSLNLIKYNPNLFTNRGSFLDVVGERSLITVGVFALGFFLYRRRVNALRGFKHRESIWNNVIYSFYGAGFGALYSSLFFVRWQVLANDFFAQYLFKRYKGSNEIQTKHIYHLKDEECREDVYNFSNGFFRSYHIHL